MNYSDPKKRVRNLKLLLLVLIILFAIWLVLNYTNAYPGIKSALETMGISFFLIAVAYDFWTFIGASFLLIFKNTELKSAQSSKKDLYLMITISIFTAVISFSVLKYSLYLRSQLEFNLKNKSQSEISKVVVLVNGKELSVFEKIQAGEELRTEILVHEAEGSIDLKVVLANGKSLEYKLLVYVNTPVMKLPKVNVIVRDDSIERSMIGPSKESGVDPTN